MNVECPGWSTRLMAQISLGVTTCFLDISRESSAGEHFPNWKTLFKRDEIVMGILWEAFDEVFEDWIRRFRKCYKSRGEYVE
jgi:hypothetical protein